MSTLKARFIGDGSGPPHVTGAFAMPNRGAGQAVTWTAIALAESGGNTDARAECADGDGDSLIGLQWLTVHFRDNQTRDLKLVTFAPDSEIDSSGTYMMHVRGLSDEELSFEVTVRLKGSFGEVDVVE